MVSTKSGFVSKHGSGFVPSGKSELPFSPHVLSPEIEAREKLLTFQSDFAGKKKRSAKDVNRLIDQMVSFEKIRSGQSWRDKDADEIAGMVRAVAGSSDRALDLGAFQPRRSATMARLVKMDVPELDLDFDLPRLDHDSDVGERQRIDLNAVNHGTYFDKWYSYNGAWTLVTLYDLARTAPPLSFNFIQAHNLRPGGEDVFRATCETGIWFTYVPDRDGYVTLMWTCENTIVRNYREYIPDNTGSSTLGITMVEAVVGIWADEFAGREYMPIHKWAAGPVDERKTFSPVIISNSTYPVKAGKPVNVMVGTRSKLLASCKGTGLNAGVGAIAPITAMVAATRSRLEPYNPFAW